MKCRKKDTDRRRETESDDSILIRLYLLLSDLCSSDHLPEVEIFSLLEEQIPKYKLRADTLTQFTGYQNEVSTIILKLLGRSTAIGR